MPSIAMRDQALRRASDIVVRISFFTSDSRERSLTAAVSNQHTEIDVKCNIDIREYFTDTRSRSGNVHL